MPTPVILVSEQTESGPGHSAQVGGNFGVQMERAQGFKVPSGSVITALEAKIRSVSGSPTGNIHFRLETNSAGKPTGTLAFTGAYGDTAIVAGWQKATLSSPGYIPANTTYHVRVYLDDQADANYIDWYEDRNNPYADGTKTERLRPGAWSIIATIDMCFRVWGYVLSPPTAPSGCTSHYVATNNAKCTWSDNSDNETNFRIEKDIDDAGFSFWKNVNANVEDSGTYTLGANKKIRFRVRAYNQAGYSAWSTSGYVYTTPNAPSGATTHYVATNYAKLTWTDQSAYEDGFKLQYAIGAGGWTDWKTVGANVQDSGNYNAGANTRIKFRVCAYKGSLYSAYSEGAYVYTIPTAPSGINLSWLTQDETVRVQWTDNSAYEQDFDIERAIDAGAFSHIVYDVASPYDDAGPSGLDHRYQYRVRARCPDGRLSSWNTSGYIYSTPNAPTSCSISLGTINVSWNDNSAYEDGFKIDRQLDDGGWSLVHTTGQNVESWADTSQPTGANEKYQYRVRAYKGALYSSYSTSNVLFAKSFSESISLGDTLVKAPAKVVSETLQLADSFSRVWGIYRTFTESLTLSDTLIRGRIFSEVISLSDSLIKKPGKIFSEQITLADSYLRRWTIYRTFTETINLADSIIKKAVKTFRESLNLSDALIKKPSKVFTESLTLSDSLIKKPSKVFTEMITLSDSLIKKAGKVFAEKITLTDSYSRIVTWYRTFTETIHLTATIKAAKVNLVNLIKKLIHLEDIEN